MIKRIEVPDTRNGGTFIKEVYQIHEGDELVGIILGHFAPFTGPKGHGRMIEALRDIGCNKFMIAIPETKKGRDDNRNMFTLSERIEIAEDYLVYAGLDGKVVTYNGWDPKVNNTKLYRRALKEFGEDIRPVFCYGPDRQNFVDGNIPFDSDLEGRRCEYIICQDRGETECSGTEVRNKIREGDVEAICHLTGYDEEFSQMLIDIYNKGKSLTESRLNEGGNMSIANDDGTEVMATKLQTGKMTKEQFEDFRQSFFHFLKELNRKFEIRFGEKIWNNESLITEGKIYSGSTRAFFQKSFEDFTKYKKSVGDFDIQLPESCKDDFTVWVEELTGRTIGDFTFYGSRTKGEQSHSLVTVNQDKFPGIGAEYVQFDWEYTPWDEKADKPSEWNDVSHYSSWEDIENGVKGAFVKILLKAAVQTVSARTRSPFYSLKTGRPVKTPEDAKEFTFNVDKGVTRLLTNVNDGYGKLETKDRTSVRDMAYLFERLFGRTPTEEEKRNLVSFVRLIRFMNNELETSVIQRIYERFLELLYGVHEQQISRDLGEDKEVKRAAADKFMEICPAVHDWKEFTDQKEEEYFTSPFRKEGNRYGQADARARKAAEAAALGA